MATFRTHDDEKEDVSSGDVPAQIGKYTVKRLLGSGGMGRVYLAVDPDIGREVAIKLVTLGSDLRRASASCAKRRLWAD